jgi:hypothetical protein
MALMKIKTSTDKPNEGLQQTQLQIEMDNIFAKN